MIVDCDACAVRGPACDDCVIGVILGDDPVELDAPATRAIGALAESGLVPPLRLSRRAAGCPARNRTAGGSAPTMTMWSGGGGEVAGAGSGS